MATPQSIGPDDQRRGQQCWRPTTGTEAHDQVSVASRSRTDVYPTGGNDVSTKQSTYPTRVHQVVVCPRVRGFDAAIVAGFPTRPHRCNVIDFGCVDTVFGHRHRGPASTGRSATVDEPYELKAVYRKSKQACHGRVCIQELGGCGGLDCAALRLRPGCRAICRWGILATGQINRRGFPALSLPSKPRHRL